MKMSAYCKLLPVLVVLLFASGQSLAQSQQRVSHVVLIWLKEPGSMQMRQQFIKASKRLNTLPGVISRHVGKVLPSNRKIVDNSFDVAVTVTLESKQALQDYLNHPLHQRILKENLKPLVDKAVAYDFISD